MIAQPQPQLEKPIIKAPMRPGANVLIGRNSLGFWVSGSGGGGGNFNHPFTVTVSGGLARVSRGLIIANIALEPVIGEVPISGDDKRPQPALKLDPSKVNGAGESWICVQVKPDDVGQLDAQRKTSRVEIMQAAYPSGNVGASGRTPLAMLFYNKNGLTQVFQIAMFNLRYETSKSTSGPRKHFFT